MCDRKYIDSFMVDFPLTGLFSGGGGLMRLFPTATWMFQEVSKWLVNVLQPTGAYKWGILGL